MLQEKHFDLIHFGTVTCNTISGKINWRMASADNRKQGRRNMRPVGWNSKNHNCGSPCQSSIPQVGVQCSCAARRLKRMKGWVTFSQSCFHLSSGSASFYVWLTIRSQRLQSFPLAQPGSWSSLTHFIIQFSSSVGHSYKFYTADPTR